MDIGSILPGELSGIATGLERQARRLEVCAVQVRVASAASWQGEAADLHRERVGRHADATAVLAGRVREAAGLVRELQAVADARLALVGEVDLTALLP